jgi:SNF2 family DNA or RNA helicase
MHVGRWKKPYMARPIKKVESCGMAATRCIAVNTKRNLYVTDGYIVTHNTISAATALMDPRLRPAIIVAPTNLTGQWQDVFHEFFVGMRTHVIKQNAYYDLPKYRKCSKCNVWSMQKLRHGKPEHLGVCRKCQHTLVGDCADADIFLTSYHKLHSWVDVLGPVCKSVVFDEAHELRREDSQKYRAASRLCRMVDYRLGLSATPVHNLGGELYNVFQADLVSRVRRGGQGAGANGPGRVRRAFAFPAFDDPPDPRRGRSGVAGAYPCNPQDRGGFDGDRSDPWPGG